MLRFLFLCLLALSTTTPLTSETFRNPRRIGTDRDPIGIKVADFNNDGLPDLIYGLQGLPSTLYVMLGQPGGAYASPAPVTAPLTIIPNCTVIDVNSDHRPDLVCPDNTLSFQASLLTFPGNGDGTFQAPITAYQVSVVTASPALAIITSADVNNDGKPDLILNAPNTTTFSVLLGDGAGHFSLSYTLPTGYSTLDLLNIADVNGDGKPDIVRSFGTSSPDVLLGKGDGTFTSLRGPSLQPTLHNCIVKKDFDGDNHLDAVCGINFSGQAAFIILHGNPDGSFNTSPLATIAVSNPHDFIRPAFIEDINHDGLPDVLAYSNEALLVFLAKPGLKFDPPVAYHIGYMEVFDENRATFADANADGSIDVLTGGVNGVYISYGHPDGTFDTAGALFSGLSVSRATAADFNNDGLADIVTSDPLGLNLTLGAPNGSFAASVPLPSAPINLIYTAPFPLLHGDFDGDGNQDLVVQGTMSNNVSPQGYFLHGNGDATFAPPVVIPYVVGGEPATIGTNSSVADLNHDGHDDLISADRTFIHSRISLTGGGFSSTFASPIPDEVAVGTFPPFTVGDFDRDGIPDVVLGLKNIYFLHGKGDGTFASPGPAITVPQTPNYVTAIASADFDQDGNLDLAVLEQFSLPPFQSLLFIYYGKGDGTFTSPVTLPALHVGLNSINIADFNRDGRPDLLLTCGGSGCLASTTGIYPVNVIHSLANRTFSQPDYYVGGVLPSDTAVADVSGDGYPDIILANGANLGNAVIPLINLSVPDVTLSLNIQPNPVSFGQSVTITGSVTATNPADPAPTGTLTLTDNSDKFVTMNPPSFSLKEIFTPGSHVITLTYSGDAQHSPASKSVTLVVNPAATTTALQSSVNPSLPGQSVTFTAVVSSGLGAQYASTLTAGTVTLSGLPGSPVTLPLPATPTGSQYTSVSYTTSPLPSGIYSATATFSGNNALAASTSPVLVQRVAATTTTTLTANPATAYPTQTITLATRVSGALNAPTGIVRILDGTAPLTTLTLTSGTATFNTSQLAPGTHTLTAIYNGDPLNLASTSSPVTVTILPSDFTLAFAPSSISLVTGHHTTIHLTAMSTGTFADNLRLGASNLPQWVTVQFKPVDLKLTAGGTATTSVYVDTDAVIGYMSQANQRPSRTPGIPAAAASLALLLAPTTLRRRRRIASLLTLTIAAALLAAASGCSGKYPDSTSPGVYTLQITAAGAQTGLTHTINLPLTVTQQ